MKTKTVLLLELGQEVNKGVLHPERTIIKTINLTKGVYIINITKQNNVVSRKLLIE